MKLPTNDYRAFRIMLIPALSPSKRFTSAFASKEHAALFGTTQAEQRYPGEQVEVIVIRTATREAVHNILIERKTKGTNDE